MKSKYIKPETELIDVDALVPLCVSNQVKGTVNTLFGSDLPEEQFGHSEWVLEGWSVSKSVSGFDALEIEGDDDGILNSR